MLQTASGPILEVPVATAVLWNVAVAPVGGGAYLRLLPYCYTAAGIRRIHREARLRTYGGISGMRRKLEPLLAEFRFCEP
jgi:hypothetical protein